MVVAGVWLTGGVVTDDAGLAKSLTVAWLAIAGIAAGGIARRSRSLAAPVLATWFVTTVVVGGFLLLTSSVDRVVDEQVVVASAPPATSAQDAVSATVPALVASGRFRSGAHPTSGIASVVRRSGGGLVLTLTRFATSPGPDLRVRLVPPGGRFDEAEDIGRLKGNRGNQQYAVPRWAHVGTVVVWCRAFSVAFGSARLHSATGW
jgi:hypothetical protein